MSHGRGDAKLQLSGGHNVCGRCNDSHPDSFSSARCQRIGATCKFSGSTFYVHLLLNMVSLLTRVMLHLPETPLMNSQNVLPPAGPLWHQQRRLQWHQHLLWLCMVFLQSQRR